jgi:hypothetical protein
LLGEVFSHRDCVFYQPGRGLSCAGAGGRGAAPSLLSFETYQPRGGSRGQSEARACTSLSVYLLSSPLVGGGLVVSSPGVAAAARMSSGVSGGPATR